MVSNALKSLESKGSRANSHLDREIRAKVNEEYPINDQHAIEPVEGRLGTYEWHSKCGSATASGPPGFVKAGTPEFEQASILKQSPSAERLISSARSPLHQFLNVATLQRQRNAKSAHSVC